MTSAGRTVMASFPRFNATGLARGVRQGVAHRSGIMRSSVPSCSTQ